MSQTWNNLATGHIHKHMGTQYTPTHINIEDRMQFTL